MKLRFLRSDRGTSLVEFAIVLPVLMFLLVGLSEFGRFGYYAILAANAARAGVQYGAQKYEHGDRFAGYYKCRNGRRSKSFELERDAESLVLRERGHAAGMLGGDGFGTADQHDLLRSGSGHGHVQTDTELSRYSRKRARERQRDHAGGESMSRRAFRERGSSLPRDRDRHGGPFGGDVRNHGLRSGSVHLWVRGERRARGPRAGRSCADRNARSWITAPHNRRIFKRTSRVSRKAR